MRWLVIVGLLLACSVSDSGDDSPFTGSSPTSTPVTSDGSDSGSTGGSSAATSDGSGSSDSGGLDTGSTAATVDTSSGPGDASSSGGGPDCTAPADCAECWYCAAHGPCMATYQACQAAFNCVPSLACVESMCTEGGLAQDCTSTCCISCTDLGTCGMVDGVISCIEQQCTALCGDVTCP